MWSFQNWIPTLAFQINAFDTIPCSLVCGPCGKSLNVVKQISCLLAGVCADMSAGPSELFIITDGNCDWIQIQ